MASKRVARSITSFTRDSVRQQRQPNSSRIASTSCPFSTTSCRQQIHEIDDDWVGQPRWQKTPARMQAPVRTRPLPLGGIMPVNEDPEKLDAMYEKLLGESGGRLLTEDTKWLAVTHKSFDHGRRGMNDRLTLLGKRILDLHSSLALLAAPIPQHLQKQVEDDALAPFANVTPRVRQTLLDKNRLAQIARRYDIHKVTRWRPRNAMDLHASGEDLVISGSLCAIIGALAMERGGDVAVDVVKQKILKHLGLGQANYVQ